jgi:hypothetical protein
LSAVEVAEKGIFNKPNMTPVKAVEMEMLHEVLLYMESQSSKSVAYKLDSDAKNK